VEMKNYPLIFVYIPLALMNIVKAFQNAVPRRLIPASKSLVCQRHTFLTEHRRFHLGVLYDIATPSERDQASHSHFWSLAELQKMKVAELKKACKFRGLRTAGRKQELIDRLMEAAQGDRDAIAAAAEEAARMPLPVQEPQIVPMPEEHTAIARAPAVPSDFLKSGANPLTPAAPVEGTQRKEQMKWFVLQFDGGARGNPGPGGAGYSLSRVQEGCEVDDMSAECRQEVFFGQHYLGTGVTNNEAEYAALLKGLEATASFGIKNLKVEGDSNLIVQQVRGNYRVKAENLLHVFAQCQAIIKTFDSFDIQHIPRRYNYRSDDLANDAMDNEESFTQQVILKDTNDTAVNA